MKKILIIEDDATQQEVYQLKLGKKYDLSFITSAREVQKQIEIAFPDLIILDIMLTGGQNGFDILQTLKAGEKTKSIPVIMLTNLGIEQRQTALECGASEYHTKTNIGPEELEQIIAKYI